MHLKNLELEHCTDEELALMAEKDSEAMCILLSRYTRLIRWKASMMCGSVEADDLAQEGFMGLLSAVTAFDKQRKIKFSTYANICITNRMVSALRNSSGLPMPVGDISEPVFEMPDTNAQPDSIVLKREEWADLWRKITSQLSDFEYQICIMFIGGLSYMEIADKLGVSVKSVNNALQRVRSKMRKISM